MAKSRKRQDGDSFVSAETSAAATADQERAFEQSGPEPDRISQRAYELYLARGGSDGRDWDDWLEAERELRGGTRLQGGGDE